MKEIPLTQGKVAVVDDEDFELIAAFKWFAHKQTKAKTYYAERNIHVATGRRKPLAMHVYLLDPPPGYQVDHVDGDGLNNRRINLRICRRSQNQGNARIRKDCSSGVKGVTFHKREKKWRARIQVNHKRMDLGRHRTKDDAAEAYAKAAFKYFGEFARPECVSMADHVLRLGNGRIVIE